MSEKTVYKAEEKLKIVLEGMIGTISVADLCRKYNIGTARFYYWKDQFMKSAPGIFESRDRKADEDRIRAEKDGEISRLKDVIAEITQENLKIKKKIGERLQRRGRT
ncbi:MAG: transposase [Candidatus Thermoplasmatota archaeon]|jgi:transposase-like protein|nr:transposase [Candidatus Thermoplasmatota archaeon]